MRAESRHLVLASREQFREFTARYRRHSSHASLARGEGGACPGEDRACGQRTMANEDIFGRSGPGAAIRAAVESEFKRLVTPGMKFPFTWLPVIAEVY